MFLPEAHSPQTCQCVADSECLITFAQVCGPIYKLVSTNLGGEKRFAAAVARRLQVQGSSVLLPTQQSSNMYQEYDRRSSLVVCLPFMTSFLCCAVTGGADAWRPQSGLWHRLVGGQLRQPPGSQIPQVRRLCLLNIRQP